MENIFKKFLGKRWFSYRSPEIARLILKQICEDTKTYMRRVVSYECSFMDLYPPSTGLRRSMSTPNFKTKIII